jgi:hypothetical protein
MNGASARVVQGLVLLRTHAPLSPNPAQPAGWLANELVALEITALESAAAAAALQEARLAKVRERPTRDLEHKTKKPRGKCWGRSARSRSELSRSLAASSSAVLRLWGFTLTLLRSL